MRRLRTFIFVMCFRCAASAYLLQPAEMNYESARSNCTLATPPILYSDREDKVDLSKHEELLQMNEMAWVGYTRDYAVFRFYGCFPKANTTRSANYTIRHDIGLCKYVCSETNFIGILAMDTNVADCYCITDFDYTEVTSCGSSNTSSQFVFGSTTNNQSVLAIYGLVPKAVEDLSKFTFWSSHNERCLCFYGQLSQFEWAVCSSTFMLLCTDGINETNGYAFYEWNPWSKTVNYCLQNGSYPMPYLESFDSKTFSDNVLLPPTVNLQNAVLWTSDIKAFLISVNTDSVDVATRQYGYIKRNDDGSFSLMFDSYNQNYSALCSDPGITSSTKPTQITSNIQGKNQTATGSSNGKLSSNTDTTDSIRIINNISSTPIASQVFTGTNNSRMLTSTDTTDTLRTNFTSTTHQTEIEKEGHDDTNTNESKTKSNVAVFVGTAVGIFLLIIVAVILVILYKKRRTSEKHKRSKKKVNVDKTSTIVNNVVNYDKGEGDEMKHVVTGVIEENRWSEPTRKSANNYSSFALGNKQTDQIKANDNMTNTQNKKVNGYDYAKVMRGSRIREDANWILVGDGRFKTDTDTDYDHLDKKSAPNKKQKYKYQDADIDIGNIYNKIGSLDVVDSYDRIENENCGSNTSLSGTASGNDNQSNVFNKLKYNTNGDNDTYSHIKSSDYYDKQTYFGTKSENMNKALTDNPYDHSF